MERVKVGEREHANIQTSNLSASSPVSGLLPRRFRTGVGDEEEKNDEKRGSYLVFDLGQSRLRLSVQQIDSPGHQTGVVRWSKHGVSLHANGKGRGDETWSRL